MTILFPALGFALAALCIWPLIRLVNRRERWAKWTLATVIGLPVLYVASFGPVCWVNERFGVGTNAIAVVYDPIIRLASEDVRVRRPVQSFATIGSRRYSVICNGKIEWSPVDWTELICLIESSVQPSTGELIDSIDVEDADACPVEY
jgi:hypothetical protein